MGRVAEDEHTGDAAGSLAPEQRVFERHPLLRQVTVGVTILVVAALLVLVLVLGVEVLLASFGGVLIAVLLQAPADWVRRHTPLSYVWSLTVVVVLLLALVVGSAVLLAPEIAEQAEQLTEKVPDLMAEMEEFLEHYAWGRWILDQGQNGGFPEGALERGASILSGLTDLVTYALLAFFVGLFAAASPRLYLDGVAGLTPLRYRENVREMLSELASSLRWWLLGQGVTMVIIGVSTMIVMWAFGLPLAIVVGLVVGLLGFIPYLGPIIGVIPVAAIAVTEGFTTLVYVMIAYAGVQMLEGYVAVPLVHERTVYLPPVFTIVVQVLMGLVLGMIGFVLATPVAAVLLVLSRFYRRDILQDPEAREELAGQG